MKAHYSGHLKPVQTKTGKHYQMVIEGPRDVVTGKRQRKYETLRMPKREAERLLHQRIAELNTGLDEHVKPQLITLKGWFRDWMALYKQDLSPSTQVDYEWRFTHYIAPYFGSQSLSEIHGIEMQKFINSLQKGKKPLSSKSIRNTYNILNAMFSKALALHLIQENPCSTVSLPKKDSKPRSALNREEVARYLECAEGTDLALIFILEFSLGLRLGELCGLRWQDIDLDKGTAHICNTRINAGGKVIEKGPKTAAGNRTIVLGAKLISRLRLYKETACGAYVIVKSDGTPYSPSSITRKVRRFQKKHGLPSVSVHEMRHTNASLLCEAGVDPITVKERLGHSDIATTLGIYTHATQSMEKRAAEKADEMIETV